MSQAAAQSKKVSFRAKESTACPICDENHQKEQMFQGGGRLIAGKLAQDLRRLYEKNRKFGRVSPLDYVMTVCPRCLYSSFPKDWNALNPADNEAIRMATDARRSYIEKILGPMFELSNAEDVTGIARGIAFQLVESAGVLDRQKIAAEMKDLDQPSRASLRKYGVRFG
ncbi:MAG: DUF2225 domain-containing protein, partial [Leptospira bouyouniensis]